MVTLIETIAIEAIQIRVVLVIGKTMKMAELRKRIGIIAILMVKKIEIGKKYFSIFFSSLKNDHFFKLIIVSKFVWYFQAFLQHILFDKFLTLFHIQLCSKYVWFFFCLASNIDPESVYFSFSQLVSAISARKIRSVQTEGKKIETANPRRIRWHET